MIETAQLRRDAPIDNLLGNKITIGIGGVVFLIRSSSWIFLERVAEVYKGFLSKRQPDIVLEIRFDPKKSPRFYKSKFETAGLGRVIVSTRNIEAKVDLINGHGVVDVGTSLKEEIVFIFGVFLASACALALAEKRGVLLHALGVVGENRQGYVFFGSSGSGKTTLGRLSSQHGVLNDDRVILRIIADQVLMFDTPFWDKKRLLKESGGFWVKAIHILKKDKRFYLKRLDRAQAVASFMSEIYHDAFNLLLGGHLQLIDSFEIESFYGPRNHSLSKTIFNTFCDITELTPCYELHFSKNGEDLWRYLDELS